MQAIVKWNALLLFIESLQGCNAIDSGTCTEDDDNNISFSSEPDVPDGPKATADMPNFPREPSSPQHGLEIKT